MVAAGIVYLLTFSLLYELKLDICTNNENACCDSAQDLSLEEQSAAMNMSDPECASLMKPIIVHFNLCNFTCIGKVHQPKDKRSTDFCSKVWEKCANASIMHSPFSVFEHLNHSLPSQSSPSKLMHHWPSKDAFCETYSRSLNGLGVCFHRKTGSLGIAEAPQAPIRVCLDKIGNGSYISMVPHPDGSNHIFLCNRQGKVWIATVPEDGSNGMLELDESKPFLDITDQVHFDDQFGFTGMAFHPNFVNNGRFFVSYNCDKERKPGCSGRCSCNSEVNCDPATLPVESGIEPCQYQTVVAEFTANSTASTPSLAEVASPLEVRRIFTMGLPDKGVHGGQILFGPADEFLYVMTGIGTHRGDPYNFAQNKRSLLGKILRIDVDKRLTGKEVHEQGLWGNYSIPRDNPYKNDTQLAPEIWALGLRNPWRCSFDSERPSYFLCGDAGQDQYEEIDMITKGGNYGWSIYEGPYTYKPSNATKGSTFSSSNSLIFPVMGYNHSEADKNIGSASITGGYFYRSQTDPCLYGRYLYIDLYPDGIWSGTENPENSRNFTSSKIPYRCAHDSPIHCESIAEDVVPAIGYVVSLGEDNKKDIHILTTTGVYRVTRSSRCNYHCPKEKIVASKPPPSPPVSLSAKLCESAKLFALLISSMMLLLLNLV
ncbi:PREDICTED: HIPL1 protein-like [Nicotiana attenuata]|uniref:HIPL1 protein-like n=1 Tax=Nicotiana attenuata TaxID=49451 RepID=UPI0009050408|nr:PREDICTED: HIPL1 protein-like [Nicotiana attenuata]